MEHVALRRRLPPPPYNQYRATVTQSCCIVLIMNLSARGGSELSWWRAGMLLRVSLALRLKWKAKAQPTTARQRRAPWPNSQWHYIDDPRTHV